MTTVDHCCFCSATVGDNASWLTENEALEAVRHTGVTVHAVEITEGRTVSIHSRADTPLDQPACNADFSNKSQTQDAAGVGSAGRHATSASSSRARWMRCVPA